MNRNRPLIIALLFGASGMLHAAVGPLITSPGTGPLHYVTNGASVGASFQVGAYPLEVTSLGLFDDGSPGLAQSHSVGLWTATGLLLARVDFAPGLSGLGVDRFLYQALSDPVILQPGMRYIMGAEYPVGTTDGCHLNDMLESETWSSSVSFIEGRYTAAEAGFTFPLWGVGGLSYVGANAQFNVVPEPSTLTLFVCSTVTLAFWRVARRLIYPGGESQ